MTTVEKAYEFLETLTNLARSANQDTSSFTLEFEYGILRVSDEDDGVQIACDFVPALDGLFVTDEDFLQTLDAFQAAVLEAVDEIKRLPEGYNYPKDFLYKGGN